MIKILWIEGILNYCLFFVIFVINRADFIAIGKIDTNEVDTMENQVFFLFTFHIFFTVLIFECITMDMYLCLHILRKTSHFQILDNPFLFKLLFSIIEFQ